VLLRMDTGIISDDLSPICVQSITVVVVRPTPVATEHSIRVIVVCEGCKDMRLSQPYYFLEIAFLINVASRHQERLWSVERPTQYTTPSHELDHENPAR